MSEEKSKVVKILRSLIISSPQNGKSLRELVRDFHEFEGRRIPIFEYNTVEQFLRSTGEFLFEPIRGELIIFEKPNAESAHVSKLIAEQQKSKKRSAVSNRFNRQPIRQPVRPLNLPPRRTGPSQYPAYPTRSPQKSIFPKRNATEFTIESLKSQQNQNNNSMNRTSSYNKPVSNERTQQNGLNQQNGSSQQNVSNQQNFSTQQNVSNQQNNADLRNRINQLREKQPEKPTTFVDLTADDSDAPNSGRPSPPQPKHQTAKKSPPISPKRSESLAPTKPNPAGTRPTTQPELTKPPALMDVRTFIRPPLLPNNPFFDTAVPPPNASIQFSRMQDRLKIQPKLDAHSIVNKEVVVNSDRKSVNCRLDNARQHIIDQNNQMCDTSTGNMKRTPPQTPVTQSMPAVRTYEIQLFDYCKDNGLNIPKFKLFKVDNRYQCHVTIDNIRYSSYPTDYSTEGEARIETAKHALERLISLREQQKYEICLDSEVELAIKIYDCLKDYPTGVFSKKIPEHFLSIYGQLLPNDWMVTLAKHPECFTIEDCIDDQIVYFVEAAELEQKMDKLQLPWQEEYWSLIITCTVTTNEIWGRLIGKEHSSALDSLVTDIELELMKNKQVPNSFNVGQIYLVVVHECAYRVRVEKIDEARQQCLCFGVDEGDHRWYDMIEMFVCQNKFLKLAPQAIRFALHGMEEFDENEFAKKHLEETLLNSPPLIGQIFTQKDDFIAQEESRDLNAVIQVVLYDTTTAEDINLHQVIVDKICADIPAPNLVPLELTDVIVSHISDAGDIFIQLKQNGVHYVNKLIHKLTQSDVSSRNETLPAANSSTKNLFLVYDEETHKWCRGRLLSEKPEMKSNEMLLVDYGKTKSVPLTKIYRLESLSQALLTFPPQAMQVKLSGLPDIPEHLVSTLRGYFSGDSSAYVMKMNASNVVEVKLYFMKDGCMANVKECLEQSTELSLSRQSSTASFSRQSSTTSNSNHDQKVLDELPTLENFTLNSRKLPKFQPPAIGEYFDVEVMLTASPSNFLIRPNRYIRQWSQQMKSLQDYCNESCNSLTTDMIREGEAYACLHSDGRWYRAIVDRKMNSKIFVYYCDIGDLDGVDDVRKLKTLPDEYRSLPRLAINASMYGIKPANGLWQMDDIMDFNQLVAGKKFQSFVDKVIESNPDVNPTLEVRLVDVSTDVDICINDHFVNSGRAISI